MAASRSACAESSALCCLLHVDLGGCSAAGVGDPCLHRVDHDAFDQFGQDGHPACAVARRRAAIQRVSAVVRGADDESRAACSAAQRPEPREQPLGLRPPPPRHLHALHGAPHADIDDRLVGLEVHELAEVDLAEHHARREQRADAVMRTIDAVLAQVRAPILDRVPGGTQPERLGHDLTE